MAPLKFFVLGVLAMMAIESQAFVVSNTSPTLTRPFLAKAQLHRQEKSNVQMSLVDSYLDLFVPAVKAMQLPTPLLTWFHGANMGTVLLSMATYGAYLGLKVRNGEGSEQAKTPLPVPLLDNPTNGTLHKYLMLGSFLFFLLGAQGGLVFLKTLDQNIFESPHAAVAGAVLILFGVQFVSSTQFSNEEENNSKSAARKAHAAVGLVTFLMMYLQGFLGLSLGFSLS
uniref:Cytochrome b561 domain-containing protein n=1 Tax=Fibrocapsa japonica TaxID=94617 RepID=A0A7S2V6F8_9STRA|mmetsp:Transcript_4963/g.7517  ORF Transcript_4963/g.7517 Transcript_4963/m.7517 type:complete len:226 (+) Transcript_4963:145-822(+)|eukprot:CAMPEP_0113944628 /NCGR_PEP_ID=MMETSP1339-20121228/35031_1 /TAXON_ID=94617 /ORGANISM="Fibrocapsa japonica" /LENGTH=225 /DNA_ID=CAMNT_0000949903 /DNA_START=140 /DNA_END=817 /DNA_ORIENTATION=+ /assembly_acc=CAM_ASM_000762